uniref:DUF5683 domain-containing protein n=1 Tax=Panagrellus redivivus TaxID=6233 RepID=A0A7E4W6N7_PANRE
MIGLETWFNNFTHFFWSSQTKESVADIPLPAVEYAIWWTMKCSEAAAFVGGILVHPAYRYYLIKKLTPETTTNNSRKIIRNTCRRLQGRFLLAALASGPVLSLAYTNAKGWTEKDVRDRCYQIRINSDALVLDRLSTVGFFIGWYWKRFQGGVDGINLGIGYFAFYASILKPYTNPLLKDKLTQEDLYGSPTQAKQDETSLQRFWRSVGYSPSPESAIDMGTAQSSS